MLNSANKNLLIEPTIEKDNVMLIAKEEIHQQAHKNIDQFINKIFLGDCVDLMKHLPSNSINLIFADPPYNLSNGKKLNITFIKSGGKDLNTDKGEWDKFKNTDSYENFTSNWLKESYRILKENGSIWIAGTYHSIYLVGYLMQKVGFTILNEILWHKSDATPNMSCTRFVADHENFIWARKGNKHTFNYAVMKELNAGKQMRCIWTKGKTAGGKKVHPTQKPEWLLNRIILATSNKEDLVLDPFLGSGTTAVVAKQLGRKYTGFEINKDYFEEAHKRVDSILI